MVEIIVDRLRRVLRHDKAELFNARLSHRLDGLEVFHQIRSALRSDAVYLIQCRDIALVSQRALILDGKAMRLLLYIAHKGKHRLVGAYADLMPVWAYERPRAVAVILDHAEHVHAQTELIQRVHRHLRVVLAAVYEQKLRQGEKLSSPST